MRGLVLSGGGSRGAWQVGVLSVLGKHLDRGFDYISGTSVGAINAVGLAQHPPEEFEQATERLKNLWFNRVTKNSDIFTYRFPKYVAGVCRTSLGLAKPLENLLREELDVEAVRASGIQLHFPAVDLVTGTLTNYDETYSDLVQAVMSSSGFPFVFPLVEVEGRLETDGGLFDFAPLQPAIDAGADEVWVLATQQADLNTIMRPEEFHNVLDVGLRVIPLMVQNTLRDDLKLCGLYNEMVEAGIRKDKRFVKTRYLEPSKPLGNPLDFSGDLVKDQFALGVRDAEAWLATFE